MLPQLWLFTILTPLVLGVPVPRVSVIPSVRSSDRTSDIETSDGPRKMGIDHANKASWHLKGDQKEAGSKTVVDGQGSPSLGGYTAHGTGVSHSGGSVLNRGQDSSISGQASGINPPRSLSTGISGGTSGTPSGGTLGEMLEESSDGSSRGTSSDSGQSEELKEGGTYEGHGEHGGGMTWSEMLKQIEPIGSGSTTGSASNTGSERTTTDSKGTTTGSNIPSADTNGIIIGSESTTGSDGTTITTSWHK
ncbi:hypothetical protein HO173_001449 [Letharia columbiana]|uniref:Uncharacterized protein n=1 Tax=Letharia columbiana TaxID=112416 RepID=A0A8H6G5J1_9LECA|nr:uncharacterized protein HO173_001449 [Letharia columbiana]KAF6240776.1 hypothetical protein HO173_001449 [Letharia columbiana]